MDGNEKLFEKARFLGISVEGNSTEEKLNNIAHQIGLPQQSTSENISQKLDDIYHHKLKNTPNENQNFDRGKELNQNVNQDFDKKEKLSQNAKSINHPNDFIQMGRGNENSNIQSNHEIVSNGQPSQKITSKLNPFFNSNSNVTPNPLINETLKKQNINYNQYKNSTKEDEKLKQKLEKSRKIFQQASNIQQEQKGEKTGGVKEKVAKKGLQALGVPSSLANLLSKNTLKDNGGMPDITSIAIQSSAPIIIGVLIVGLIILISVLSIVGLVNEDDISAFNNTKEIHGYLTSNDITDEELTEKLVELNICSYNKDKDFQTSECMDSNAGLFLKQIKQLNSDYENYKDINGESIKIDIPLLLETISYNRTDSELFDSNTFDEIKAEINELVDAMVEKYQEKGDLYYEEEYTVKENGKLVTKKRCKHIDDQIVKSTNGETVYYRISDDKFISYLKYGKVHENFLGKVKIYDVDIHPDSASNCIPSGRMYKSSDMVRYSGN